MAYRLLPFRQYDENDVINLFANDTSDAKPTTNGNGSAGVFVSVKSGGGNFSKDPITYVDRTELSASYDHVKNQYPEVQLKVTANPRKRRERRKTSLQSRQERRASSCTFWPGSAYRHERYFHFNK
jgi:hypothetical protein